jgi:hypothetical protein
MVTEEGGNLVCPTWGSITGDVATDLVIWRTSDMGETFTLDHKNSRFVPTPKISHHNQKPIMFIRDEDRDDKAPENPDIEELPEWKSVRDFEDCQRSAYEAKRQLDCQGAPAEHLSESYRSLSEVLQKEGMSSNWKIIPNDRPAEFRSGAASPKCPAL